MMKDRLWKKILLLELKNIKESQLKVLLHYLGINDVQLQ